ncbi:MAG: hypothetical protein JWM33_2372, partial [Caulobacteraceae bacterium]|nr:hypothetical protein [Caulobacteraceae bacterium]
MSRMTMSRMMCRIAVLAATTSLLALGAWAAPKPKAPAAT